MLEILANIVKRDKKIKGVQIRKGYIKLSLFADYMIVSRKSERVDRIPGTNKQLKDGFKIQG